MNHKPNITPKVIKREIARLLHQDPGGLLIHRLTYDLIDQYIRDPQSHLLDLSIDDFSDEVIQPFLEGRSINITSNGFEFPPLNGYELFGITIILILAIVAGAILICPEFGDWIDNF